MIVAHRGSTKWNLSIDPREARVTYKIFIDMDPPTFIEHRRAKYVEELLRDITRNFQVLQV